MLSVFDNGETHSRGLVLSLDMKRMHASLLREYVHRPLFAYKLGSVQLLSNGDALVGWGTEPHFTEFSADRRRAPRRDAAARRRELPDAAVPVDGAAAGRTGSRRRGLDDLRQLERGHGRRLLAGRSRRRARAPPRVRDRASGSGRDAVGPRGRARRRREAAGQLRTVNVALMLVLTRAEVEELLDLDALLEALAAAHAELSAGSASLPAARGGVHSGGAARRDAGLVPTAGLGAKLVSLFPANKPPLPSHQAAIVLFDAETGIVTAFMDGAYITAMRTAAAAALAARLLARPDAACSRSSAPVCSRALRGRCFRESETSPRSGSPAAANTRMRARRRRGPRATHSPDPVVLADWLSPGAHVSSVGYNAPGSEVDPAIVARADVVCVESRDSAFAPLPAGAPELAGFDPQHTVELGELVAGTRAGRTSPGQITLYKSVGIAIQDLAAAALVLAAARERGVGFEIELEEVHA